MLSLSIVKVNSERRRAPSYAFRTAAFSIAFLALNAGTAHSQTTWTTECVSDIFGNRDCKVVGNVDRSPDSSGLFVNNEQAFLLSVRIEEKRVLITFAVEPHRPAPDHELVIETISGPDAPVSQIYKNACDWEDKTLFRFCSIRDQAHRDAFDRLFRRNSVARVSLYTDFGWVRQDISLQGYTKASDGARRRR